MTTNILFVHYGEDWLRGSEHCLLDLNKYLSQRHYKAHVWTNNRTLVKQLELMGIDNTLSPFSVLSGWKSPKFRISSWLTLVKQGCELLDEHKIQLIHINSAAPCQWMLLAARIKNVPVVTQLHSPYNARDRITLGLHLSPHTIAVSRYAAAELHKDGYPADKLSVIHNGIDTHALLAQPKVDVRYKLSIPKDDFIFATVGSLIHRKGVDRILTAMRHVAFEYPNIQLVVIGDGPLKQRLIDQADYIHLANRIHFVGEQTNVVGWLKGCNAFVSGARNEAFGLVLAEASLAKIPVIAPFEGGIPEFIRHGQNGLLYPNHGCAPLAKAMRCVINSPTICERLSKNAYHLISQQYDVSHSCAKVERVYRHLLTQTSITHRSIFSSLLPVKTYLVKRLSSVAGEPRVIRGEQHG